MTTEKGGIEGSGSKYYSGGVTGEQYASKINTPAKSTEYFAQFHAPMLERAKARVEGTVNVLDIACGPAYELDFLKDMEGVELYATDISPDIMPEVKQRLPKAHVFSMDASSSAVADGSMDAALLVNAMVYVPDQMLATAFRALKPGGELTANFRAYDNPHNKAFYDNNVSWGGIIRDSVISVGSGAAHKEFLVKVLDYRNCVKTDGTPDTQLRQLGEQTYFTNVADIEELIRLTGFEVASHELFNFASPANPDNQVDVFNLRKPNA